MSYAEREREREKNTKRNNIKSILGNWSKRYFDPWETNPFHFFFFHKLNWRSVSPSKHRALQSVFVETRANNARRTGARVSKRGTKREAATLKRTTRLTVARRGLWALLRTRWIEGANNERQPTETKMCVQPEILFRKSAGSKRIDEREPPTYPWRGMEMAAKSPRDAPVSSSDSLNWIVRFSGTERRERRVMEFCEFNWKSGGIIARRGCVSK